MLDAGVIVESKSEYTHPVCLVPKKDGSVRYCIDMRLLKQYTVKDQRLYKASYNEVNILVPVISQE